MAALLPRWRQYTTRFLDRADVHEQSHVLLDPDHGVVVELNFPNDSQAPHIASVLKMAATNAAEMPQPDVPTCTRPVQSLSIQDRSPIAFSADGMRLAAVDGSHHVTVLYLENGSFQVKKLLTGHTGTLRVILFHPTDPDTLICGGCDGLVCWNVATEKPVFQIPGRAALINGCTTVVDGGHDGDVECMVWCFGGATLLTGSKDALIKVWDWSRSPPTLLETVTGHKSAVLCLSVHEGAQRLASAGRDSTIKVWDISTLSTEWRAKRADDGGVTVGLLGNLDGHRGDVTSLVWPESHVLLSGARDNRALCWSTTTWTELREVADTMQAARGARLQHHSDVRRLGLLPDNVHCLSASSDGTIKVWKLARDSAGRGEGATGKGGKSSEGADTADILGLGTGLTESTTTSAEVGPEDEGRMAAVLLEEILSTGVSHSGAKGGRVALRECDALLATVPVTDESELGVFDMAINPTRPIVAISSAANSVTLYALRPDTLPWLSKVRDGSLGNEVLPPGTDLTPLILVQAFNGHSATVTGLSLSPDDSSLLSCSVDQTVCMYDTSTAGRRARYMHVGAALCLAVSTIGTPAGKGNGVAYVFVGGADFAIRAYAADPAAYGQLKDTYARLPSPRQPPAYEYECARYVGHAGRVDAVAVHSDGRLMVSGARDFQICVWSLTNPAPAVAAGGQTRMEEDVPRISPLHRLSAHKGAVSSLSFAHSLLGGLLASGGGDHVVHVWKVGSGGDLSSAWQSGSVEGGAHSAAVSCVLWGKPGSGSAALHDGGSVAGISDLRELCYSGSWDGSIKVWSGKTPAKAPLSGASAILGSTEVVPLRTLIGHTARVSALSISADGSLLVSVSADRTARVWDIRAGLACIAVVKGAAADGALACVSAGTNLFAVGGDAGIGLWPMSPSGPYAHLFSKAAAGVRTVGYMPPQASLVLCGPSSTGSSALAGMSIDVAPRPIRGHGTGFDTQEPNSGMPLLSSQS